MKSSILTDIPPFVYQGALSDGWVPARKHVSSRRKVKLITGLINVPTAPTGDTQTLSTSCVYVSFPLHHFGSSHCIVDTYATAFLTLFYQS